MSDYGLAEICVVACAEAFRGDGEILASPIGAIPTLGVKLARATFAPDLLLSDGGAQLLTPDGVVEGWLPYRAVFDLVWSGRRHVMMGATQLDRFGNQNLSCIGPHARPKAQLIGARGAPGNTINHTTSYFVPQHSTRVFVEKVDFVCGIGTDRAASLGAAGRFHHLRLVITNLGVFDFEGGRMRVRSLHPGVTFDEIQAKTGFPLERVSDEMKHVPVTRMPSHDELRLIELLDPDGKARAEMRP
jgi:acyl CoA:acetate/3-ketoacid CoA transferase beta subunit